MVNEDVRLQVTYTSNSGHDGNVSSWGRNFSYQDKEHYTMFCVSNLMKFTNDIINSIIYKLLECKQLDKSVESKVNLYIECSSIQDKKYHGIIVGVKDIDSKDITSDQIKLRDIIMDTLSVKFLR